MAKKSNPDWAYFVFALALIIILFVVNMIIPRTPSDAHYCTSAEKSAEVCTMEYEPVCGDNHMTYSNGCQACSSGEVNYYVPGEC